MDDRQIQESFAEIGKLIAEKQQAYGGSFGKSGAIVRVLYPDGIPLDKLDDALTVIRIIDKLFRIATDRDALGESPWRDIAGYAILSVARLASTKKTPVSEPMPTIGTVGGLSTALEDVAEELERANTGSARERADSFRRLAKTLREQA